MKNILNISSITTGGAGIACLRFHKILLKNGYNSYLFTPNLYYQKKNFSSKNLENNNFFFSFLLKIKNNILFIKNFFLKINKYCIYSLGKSTMLYDMIKNIKIDYIFVHWSDGFVNIQDIENLKKIHKCKVIFMMYDMFHITGGCHYSYECKQYISGCKNCPGVPFFLKSKIFKIFDEKKKVLDKLKAEICTFSYQDYKLVLQSNFKFSKIHKLFIPIFVKNFKKKNNFNYYYILCSALKYDPRKGSDILLLLLDVLDKKINDKNKKLFFFCFDDYFLKKKYKNIFFQKILPLSNSKMSALYNKSDLFLNLSLADSAPMMITESLLHGVPVVSTNVGDAFDLIENGKNGYLIKKHNINHVANILINFLNDKYKINNQEIANRIRRKKSHNKFLKLIDKILNTSSNCQ